MGAESDYSEVGQDGQKDEETSLKKLPYPKSVFFIVSNEFCERFSFYGMRTILAIYLTNILLYSEADAKIIYHTFTMFVYFFPVLGAIISDSFLGKFRTILYVSMIYAAGNILLALASAEPIGLPQKEFSIFGLLLIALGTGGIKPCVSAFGGDQFVIPDQEIQLARFFSLFYFSINAGSLISTFLTPVLRNNVHCFDQDSCFPLAFAVPGALMILSIVIFALGKPLYKIKKPQGNVVVQVSKCIGHAISQKFKSKEKKSHWLDHAEPLYGAKLVNDIKATLKVLVLYLPLPIFWALYDQQGSGWTFQAVRMDGDIGFYTLLPDQMQVVNPLLILLFIPMFSYGIYPLFAKCNFLKTALQRMVCGGFLAAVAFAVSAVISITLEATYPVLPSSGNIQLRVYNPSACDVTFNAPTLHISDIVEAKGYYVNKDIDFTGNKSVAFTFTFTSPCNNTYTEQSFQIEEKTAVGIYFTKIGAIAFEDNAEKSDDGYPKVRTLAFDTDLNIKYTRTKGTYSLDVAAGNYSLKNIPYPGTYLIDVIDKEVSFKLGGTYTVMINEESNDQETIVVTDPNSVHMLWLLPQYFIITAAEVMYSITGLEFSYSQAPVSMKSLLQACFLLTTAFGNLIIVIIESAQIFEKQSNDFFLYTGLMVVDMLLFAYMTTKYVYVIPEDTETEELKEDEPLKKLANGIENPSFSPTESAAKE